jgi:hypothetical protein
MDQNNIVDKLIIRKVTQTKTKLNLITKKLDTNFKKTQFKLLNIITSNPLKIGVCVRVKDEQKIIKDWVNYYLKLGFDFIYIYDNLSNPSVTETLGNYDENIIKIKIDSVIKSNQTNVYQDCLNNNKHLDWLLICDADEFLYIKKGTIRDFLNTFSEDTGSVLINWLVFGTSGLQNYDNSKSIFEQFIKREPYHFKYNYYVKSFIKVKCINKINSWHKIFNSKYLIKDVNNNIIKPNKRSRHEKIKLSDETSIILCHYMTLDYNSMEIKRCRNSKFDYINNKYTISWYNKLFKDSIIDKRMIVNHQEN